jgi:hypothetical protein
MRGSNGHLGAGGCFSGCCAFQRVHSIPQVSLVHRVVALEHRHGLAPRHGHDAEVVNPRPSDVGHERVPQIMKGGVAYARLLACP